MKCPRSLDRPKADCIYLGGRCLLCNGYKPVAVKRAPLVPQPKLALEPDIRVFRFTL